MNLDPDNAATDLLREIIEQHPNASQDDIWKLFRETAMDDADRGDFEVFEACLALFIKNAIRH
jgi:hypothetical protein